MLTLATAFRFLGTLDCIGRGLRGAALLAIWDNGALVSDEARRRHTGVVQHGLRRVFVARDQTKTKKMRLLVACWVRRRGESRE